MTWHFAPSRRASRGACPDHLGDAETRRKSSRDCAVLPDASGLSRLYDEMRVELLRLLVARTGDRSEAEDLLQEIWVRLQAAESGPVANGRSYLYRAANNLVLDRLRATSRRAERETAWASLQQGPNLSHDSADQRPNAEETLLAREEAAALMSAIEALPPGARRVFRMHKIDALPQAEVAAQLGISRSAVEKHIVVALTHLRRALKD